MSSRLRRLLRAVPGAGATQRFLRERLLAGLLRRRRFVTYYAANYWRGEESRSGRGSSLVQTQALRQALPDLLRTLGVRSLLDVPCGDFHWMKRVPLDGIAYTGADIVPALVADLRARHGGTGRRFMLLDLVATTPPPADLLLCRDLLVHLSFAEIEPVLRNIRRSGATWLLTTTFPNRPSNQELLGCDWRPLNLQAPPFGFPPPLRLIDERCSEDGGQYADKSLGLWRVADLP
jgi:SAM-dependent methyltransferase